MKFAKHNKESFIYVIMVYWLSYKPLNLKLAPRYMKLIELYKRIRQTLKLNNF